MKTKLNYFSRLSLLFAMMFIIAACGDKADVKKATTGLQSLMEQSGTVGLAVAVVRDNEIIYTASFGRKSIEDNTPLKDGDIFRIASISKSFTTTTLLHLLEEGKISLDDDAGDIVGFPIRNPKFPDIPITVRMLLSHISSLNDSRGYGNLNLINPSVNDNWARSYNDYAPGTKYQYANLGFNTLGAIVEKVSGTRFDLLVKQVVIDPLGLNAGFNPDNLDRNLFATLYLPDSTVKTAEGWPTFKPQPAAYQSRSEQIDTGYMMGYSAPLFSPTGGMKISARDLARYMIMHMNYGIDPSTGTRILKEETSRLMQTDVVEVDEDNIYCMALKHTTDLIPGVRMTGHTGSAHGLKSAMFFEPERKFGFVMMTNGITHEYGRTVNGYTRIQGEVIRLLYDVFIK
ncbi:MAG: serine hydrolase domain-containing protein [Bacteroidales bacterium]|jgi:CubicO group peptidase (beta-lactamase class C family)|nr:serine hydrolase domain-containing protein [Bacteroidales bacterium]